MSVIIKNETMEYLSNGIIEIEIAPIGAELQSIRRVAAPTEYLWQGDPTYWGRRAPILFPIVGRLWENTAHFGDKSYEIFQHGFARDMLFSKIVDEDRHLAFSLRSNEESLRLWPFNFELRIDYTLLRNVLTISWSVTNLDTRVMPFQIGAHPAFMYTHYNPDDEVHGFLSFNADSPLVSTKIAPGGYADANRDLILESARMRQEELENDMQLQYNIYTQVAQQLQMAEAKVQEKTPAFTVLQEAMVPVKHANMPKIFILAVFLLLGFVLRVVWILWKKRSELITFSQA